MRRSYMQVLAERESRERKKREDALKAGRVALLPARSRRPSRTWGIEGAAPFRPLGVGGRFERRHGFV